MQEILWVHELHGPFAMPMSSGTTLDMKSLKRTISINFKLFFTSKNLKSTAAFVMVMQNLSGKIIFFSITAATSSCTNYRYHID